MITRWRRARGHYLSADFRCLGVARLREGGRRRVHGLDPLLELRNQVAHTNREQSVLGA